MSAVATLLAVGAAVWAGVTAKGIFEIEQRREKDRLEAERRSQANQFVCWISWSDQPQVAMKLPDGMRSPSLAIRNSSSVPVYDVVVTYFEGSAELGKQDFPTLSPTGSAAHYRQIKRAEVGKVLLRPRGPEVRLNLRVALAFTDAQGRRWRRDQTGELAELPA